MKFLNDLYQMKKAELIFMAEHWGIYLVLGIGLHLPVCLHLLLQKGLIPNESYSSRHSC